MKNLLHKRIMLQMLLSIFVILCEFLKASSYMQGLHSMNHTIMEVPVDLLTVI